jgi:hypothetical protein
MRGSLFDGGSHGDPLEVSAAQGRGLSDNGGRVTVRAVKGMTCLLTALVAVGTAC